MPVAFQGGTDEGRSVREEAARWYDRMSGPAPSVDLQVEYRNWLEASPAHRTAYAAVERAAFEVLDHAKDPRIFALRHETMLRLTSRTARSSTVARWAVAATVLAVIGGSWVVELGRRDARMVSTTAPETAPHSLSPDLGAFAPRRYKTGTGERLVLTLADGTRITLDARSELDTAYGPAERHVTLQRGQAFFEVAKDPNRPFVASTVTRKFVAVGTAFDVRLQGPRVELTVIEGRVRVERARPQGQAIASLLATDTVPEVTAGERLTAQGDSPDRVLRTDATRAVSWRQGQLIFEAERLEEVISAINQYSDTPIEIGDSKLADLQVSGAFSTGSPTVFLDALTAYFPNVVARSEEGRIVLRTRK